LCDFAGGATSFRFEVEFPIGQMLPSEVAPRAIARMHFSEEIAWYLRGRPAFERTCA
jgi:hypothetical protein